MFLVEHVLQVSDKMPLATLWSFVKFWSKQQIKKVDYDCMHGSKEA
jgi:hypothetical protein